MITPWLQATAKRRSGATRRHLHMSIAVGLLAGVARVDGRPLWYSLRSGSSMISCRVRHTNGSSRTGPGFSRIWESYRIFFVRIRGSFILHHLSSWLDINLQECSGSPPNRQRERKKSFRVRLRVGGKAKKTWLSVNFTSGFFLWACAVHIPKRNWLEKKINNVQSRTHTPPPPFAYNRDLLGLRFSNL